MSAIVTSEIFSLFVNTLTPDDKYSCRNMDFSDNNFKRPYLKNESLLSNFGCISEMVVKFRTFWKKRRVS